MTDTQITLDAHAIQSARAFWFRFAVRSEIVEAWICGMVSFFEWD